MYLWEHSLYEVETMTNSDMMLAYYNYLQLEAKKIIKICSRKNLKAQIAKLNTINIQLELYFLYLDISDFEDLSDEEIIFNIRKDYKKYFYETMDKNYFWRTTLLGYQIDQTYSSKFIWNMDATKMVEAYFKDRLIGNCIDWRKYKNLLSYFSKCSESANSIIEQMYNDSFSEWYPFLVGFESKCQMVIEELLFLIQFDCDGNETKSIEEIEVNYIRNVQQRLLGIYSSFEKESLRYIVC